MAPEPSLLAIPFQFSMTLQGRIEGMTEAELARALPQAVSVQAWLAGRLTGIVVEILPGGAIRPV